MKSTWIFAGAALGAWMTGAAACAGELIAPLARPSAFSRDQAVSLGFTNGVYAVVHRGARDWAVNAYAPFKARPGERFAFSATAKRLAPGSSFAASFALTFADGRQEWGYAAERHSACGAKTRHVLMPPGVVSVQPRFTGLGAFDGEIADVRLERLETTPLPDLPASWRLENEALAADVGRDGGTLTVVDRRTGRVWAPARGDSSSPRLRALAAQCASNRVELDLLDLETLRRFRAGFALDGAEIAVTVDAPADLPLQKDGLAYPPPFETRADDALIVPYSEGYRLPFGEKHKGLYRLNAWNSALCMPFFGVEDARGGGWTAILETPDDAFMEPFHAPDGRLRAVTSGWAACRGRFAYARRARFVFLASGGYVAMAKRYRRAAQAEGLVKTFREKARERPLVDRLLGAPNVWYFRGGNEPNAQTAAEELRAAGITRFLWSNGDGDAAVKAIAGLPDVLVSRYDCYRDVYRPEQLAALGQPTPPATNEIGRNTSAWPDDVIWDRADDPESWRKAWGVRDKAGNRVYCAAQCARMQIKRERRNVAAELKARPYNARFVDVTTAHGWEECENPAHPMTRTQCRAAALELLGLLGREFGLVVGSEQGMGAAVSACDYFEGMLSPGYARMPHGRPGADRVQIFRGRTNVTDAERTDVEKYATGEKYRIPLFELVFHDCCCAHWYWYDYSNRPVDLWWRRDLLNALYGTMPMFVFDHRHWLEHRDAFVRSYNLTSPIARRTGYAEMLDHRALTPDRAVQRTVFADGTVVTANFGDAPFTLPEGGVLNARSADVRRKTPHAELWARWLDRPAGYRFKPRFERRAVHDCGDFVVETYVQANGPNTTQRTFLALPKNAKGRLPGVVVPFYFPEAMLGFDPATGGLEHPFAPGRTNLSFYAKCSFVKDLARRGYAAISADAYHLTYATATAPADGWSKWKHAGEALRKDWPTWTGIGKLTADTRLLVDVLAADPRVDPDRIGMMGHSLGGKMAFYAGLLDARVKAVVASDFGYDWDRSNWSAVWYWGDTLKEARAAGLTHLDLMLADVSKPVCFLLGQYDGIGTDTVTRGLFGDPRAVPPGCTHRRHFSSPQHRPSPEAVQAAYAFLDEYVKNRP